MVLYEKMYGVVSVCYLTRRKWLVKGTSGRKVTIPLPSDPMGVGGVGWGGLCFKMRSRGKVRCGEPLGVDYNLYDR